MGLVSRGGYFCRFGTLSSDRCQYNLVWRGVEDWCQPWQFRHPESVWAAADTRLKQAGLRLVALATELGSPDHPLRLLAEVARTHQPHARAVRRHRQLAEWATRLQASAAPSLAS